MPGSIVAPFGPWDPAQPPEAAAIFAAMPCPWWIAGGFAIELAVGRPVRDHGDIDVLVLRQDHLRIQQALRGWEWWAADPPGTLRPWLPREQMPAAIHDIWCRYLAPEIQLFYKAKNLRPKEETDFTAVLPFLSQQQRQWLSDAIARTRGDYPWRDRLQAAGS